VANQPPVTNQSPLHRHNLKAIAHKAMIDRGLQPDFPPAALTETQQIVTLAGSLGGAAGVGDIRDQRDLMWVSIDNDDSRDLDQLSVAEALPAGAADAAGANGGELTRVLVAIADVDALVKKGSAIDAHAQLNTTSVYTDAEIFPMLPTQLSTDKTSLNEDQERLAIVIEMVVGGDGSITKSDVYRARVKNKAKLAYNSVAAWLENTGPAPERVASVPGVAEQLRLQDKVAQCLRNVRHENGALSLQTIEPRAVFKDDVLSDLRLEEKNRAKELIEDLMIAANGVTARFLAAKGVPSLRRVLRSPERWARIVALAENLNSPLPPEPDAAALETFLSNRRRADPVTFPDLSLAIVKLMGRGEYVLESPGAAAPGHFGLAVQDYTHSTAPNRRFPDLITQRLLKATLSGGGTPYTPADLDALARHCTEQEDAANKVERQVRKSAAALLLETHIGERYDAIVTGAGPKGTFVRITKPPAEGMLVRGGEGLDVGARLTVELVETNVERGFIDFARVKG
jgi:exoribonuclease-2